jgi:hypothetical protein
MRLWLCIVSSLALVMGVFSSPIRTPLTPSTRVQANFLYRNFALVSKDTGPVLSPASPDAASLEADGSDYTEEDEDETFGSFSGPVDAAFLSFSSRRKPLPSPLPGHSPPRSSAVPLRC